MISGSDLSSLLPGILDPEGKARSLTCFGSRLLELGSVRGVTALKTAEAIRTDLLLDSLAGLASLPATGRVIDIGTGGGVPGLVLAVVRPDLEFTLTDSSQRKTAWVQECVDDLGLPNVVVKTARLEILGRDQEARERYDAVTAKALANLAVLVELAMPLLKIGGLLIAYKGPALPQELAQAERAMHLLKARLAASREYSLAGKSYTIAEIVKTGATASRYPRRDGVPQKTPL
jgi:16S rRNA (guanine527-N7)-methyltransferase